MYRLTKESKIVKRLSDGASVPDSDENADGKEFRRWLADGNTPEPYVPPTPTQDQIDAEFARTYQKLQAIRNMTPQQVADWVEANVNTLAQAKDALKTLAVAVCVLARRI